MRYAGGKGRCFHQIINLMPPHAVYLEAFVGGGAVLRNKRPAERSIVLDLDNQAIERLQQLTLSTAVEFICGDAIQYLSEHRLDECALVYADPPYLPSTRRRSRVYQFDLTEDDHRNLLDALLQQRCQVMVSGYPSELYDRTLAAWTKTEFFGTSHVGRRTEVVWSNFKPSAVLHDYRYVGDNFRERERIRRLVGRWQRRLTELSSREREAVLRALQQVAETERSPAFQPQVVQ